MYWAVKIHDSVLLPELDAGPHPDHDAAMKVHIDAVERHRNPNPFRLHEDPDPYWRRAVLVDPSALRMDSEAERDRLLMLDPFLSAVFEWGRQAGWQQAEDSGRMQRWHPTGR